MEGLRARWYPTADHPFDLGVLVARAGNWRPDVVLAAIDLGCSSDAVIGSGQRVGARRGWRAAHEPGDGPGPASR